MASSPQRKIAYGLVIFFMTVPFLVMIWDVQIGVGLLLINLFISYRVIRYSGRDAAQNLSDAEMQRLERHQSERGRTIYVQLVDDDGQELPPDVAQKRLFEAEARSNPRDVVVGVHQVISRGTDTSR